MFGKLRKSKMVAIIQYITIELQYTAIVYTLSATLILFANGIQIIKNQDTPETYKMARNKMAAIMA